MIVTKNLKWSHIFHYTWQRMAYFLILSIIVYILHVKFGFKRLSIPFNAVATLSTALAIYLGFKNNNAYDRWWEARKIWGLIVNYSRAWAREVITFILPSADNQIEEVKDIQQRLLYRHIAFVHALRVFIRVKHAYNENATKEIIDEPNRYEDIKDFISAEEYKEFLTKKNPPNFLIKKQSEDLKLAFKKGYISDYRYVKLSDTLTQFNNHQGMSERIKNTPLPRPYSFFSRVFVFIHGTLLPFAFIEDLGVLNIPLSVLINFVFLALDFIGERTEDPFENRLEDTPLTSISVTIEENIKEMIGDYDNFPRKPKPKEGVII
ncbi:bestrophin family protein [Neptunitalea lumnitzerae]|uniref:Uncharacterized protein n=1 Tax=Neptunitalea lumnitzerae TaxID=2965509 RepID=A0ABQ5MLI8_9FLAO|nr:bestrophin family ion channel [Neptunitalea sp. Y10]GLB50171.1 hypothetical protein Y10_25390 [Neptunitalea sp. Y10]